MQATDWTRRSAAAAAVMIAIVCPAMIHAGDAAVAPPFRSHAYPWDLDRGGSESRFTPTSYSPQSALNQIERSYRDLDLEAYASLLTEDFRFVTDNPRFEGLYPQGFDRITEVSSAAGLFGVAPAPGMPQVLSIQLDLGLVGEGADPEHADSLDHYRLLVAPNPTMTVHAAGDLEFVLSRTLQAFYLVRGDAAVLHARAPAEATRWYVRRWVETPEETAAEAAADGTPARATLQLANDPATGPFTIVLSVQQAGLYQIDVFDVAGRRLGPRPPVTLQPGTTRLDLSDTGKLPAGIYWLRLSRDGRPLATRVATRL